MSNRSAEKAGSEGDADSKSFSEGFANFLQGSPPYKNKRELEIGGPSGDAPAKSEISPNYYYLMMTDNDSSEDENVNYIDIKTQYLDQINIIRHKLALVGLADENGYSKVNRGCEITEIVDEDINCDLDQKVVNNLTTPDKEQSTANSTEDEHLETDYTLQEIQPNVSLETIFEFSKDFTVESSSSTNFEIDYNPPKKKYCVREKTPIILTTSSEGAMKPNMQQDAVGDGIDCKSAIMNDEKKSLRTKSEENTKSTRKIFEDGIAKVHNFTNGRDIVPENPQPNHNLQYHTHIFPKVIIKYLRENDQKTPPKGHGSMSDESKQILYKEEDYTYCFNSVEPSDSSGKSRTTTISSSRCASPKKKKHKFRWSAKVESTEKLTLWDEIRSIHSVPNNYATSTGTQVLDDFDSESVYETKSTQKIETSLETENIRNENMQHLDSTTCFDDCKDVGNVPYACESISVPQHIHDIRKNQLVRYECYYTPSSHSEDSKENDKCNKYTSTEEYYVCSCFCLPKFLIKR